MSDYLEGSRGSVSGGGVPVRKGNDHSAVRVLALGPSGDALHVDEGIMHDLAVSGVHRLENSWLTGRQHVIGDEHSCSGQPEPSGAAPDVPGFHAQFEDVPMTHPRRHTPA